MSNLERLKEGRNALLKLHKSLVDFERENYEAFNGAVTPAAFLGQLLENPDLSWLRRFSMLIVEIDELLSQKDAVTDASVLEYLETMRKLVRTVDEDLNFKARYELALRGSSEAARLRNEVSKILDAL